MNLERKLCVAFKVETFELRKKKQFFTVLKLQVIIW